MRGTTIFSTVQAIECRKERKGFKWARGEPGNGTQVPLSQKPMVREVKAWVKSEAGTQTGTVGGVQKQGGPWKKVALLEKSEEENC